MVLLKCKNYNELYNLTLEQKNIVKEDLTLNNPKYIQACKYSKYKNIRIPKYLYYYLEKNNILYTPTGYDIPFPYDLVEDFRNEITVDYPAINIQLRGTQVEAYNSFLDNPNGIIQLATGKGKSILAIYIAQAIKQKTLVIVHKDDLIVGWRKDIEMCFNGEVKTGLIKAKKREIGEQITLATIQTLSRMSKEELNNYTKIFGLIVVDEVHHASSDSYSILNSFYAPYKIGLTATPERSDNLEKVLHFRFGDFIFQFQHLKNDVDILPVMVYPINTDVCYRPKARKVGNDYVFDDIKGTIYIDEIKEREKRPTVPYHLIDDTVIRDKLFVKMYLKDIVDQHKKGRSIIVFLRQKEHCRFIKEKLIDKGINEENIMLYYGDSKEKKSVMMERAENQRNLITIATLSVATEGTNIKQWEVAFLLSSLADGKATEQAIGRIRRTTSKPKLKKPLVFDYRHPNVYAIKNHAYVRNNRYIKLKLDVHGANTNTFSRGYN